MSTGSAPHPALAGLAHALEQVLPSQAPLKDFVHHNTLHGFQHLPFREAVGAAAQRTDRRGFLPAAEFRRLYRAGRIAAEDLDAVLAEAPGAVEIVARAGGRELTRTHIRRAALLTDAAPLAPARLRWELGENGTPAHWPLCLALNGIELEDAAAVADEYGTQDTDTAALDREVRAASARLLEEMLERVGRDWTLRDLLKALSGEDLMAELRPWLVKHLAAHLDQGMAVQAAPRREQGLYAAWRENLPLDATWLLTDLAEWRELLERLPDQSADMLAQELMLLGLEPDSWTRYLELLALELPGWSGMFLWREHHPGYAGLPAPMHMHDYLAVRLAMERLYAKRLTRRLWRVQAGLPAIRWQMRHHPSELIVRQGLYGGELPEPLANGARALIRHAALATTAPTDADWAPMARRIVAWRSRPDPWFEAGARAWPLARLSEALGLAADELVALGPSGAAALLAAASLDEDEAGWYWLQAYERNYRERVFASLVANHGRGAWRERRSRPQAQVVFCMDDREEGFRRHLEERAPAVETLGAAAHFNVPHAYRGLHADTTEPLCPIVPVPVIPAHEAHEIPRAEAPPVVAAVHARRHGWRRRVRELLHQRSRFGLVVPALVTLAAAPAVLLSLLGRLLDPGRHDAQLARWRLRFEKRVATRLRFTAPPDSPPADPAAPRLGFTDSEQFERVHSSLRAHGLTRGLAPLVVIAGHASRSRNNPHAAAYNCGACGGRFSGPNARLLAAMANRPEVRARLAGAGIAIPADTWFVGAEHDTCSERVAWYDTEDLPDALRPHFAVLRLDIEAAADAHAQERCRRLMSAPLDLAPPEARRHVAGRAADLSQARPELGHVTNACAFIGRRAMSRGAFLDRRAFLISYDPAADPDGAILERHLFANGAVGAGICLEYYFSTVNNERYGAGTKVTHNVAGLLGVMEGVEADLRTGLPQQMIEIHEAMRLLVVVEQRTDIVTAIYRRHPVLREMIGNGWVVVAAKDPDAPAIHLFDPARGWLPWRGAIETPRFKSSRARFAGCREALPPALLEQHA